MSYKINWSCNEIAELLNRDLIGAKNLKITGLNRIEYAVEGELSFFSDNKYEKYLGITGASCLIVPLSYEGFPPPNCAYIKSAEPYRDFVRLLHHISTLLPLKISSVHPSAIIDKSSEISDSAYIGPNCSVGKNCKIGQKVILHSNVSIYDNVVIGDGTLLHAGVVCCDDTKIGRYCILHPGVIIGSDGFGFIEHHDGSYEKIPQLGNVIIEDEVEIGSNTTIDRALVGSTIIEKGVKIDNLVQIGHNAIIGENTAIVSQTGVSGSSKLGKRNRLGGQVGVSGHLETVDDVIILAQSGIAKSVTKKGMYFGSPIKERMHAFRIENSLNQLPEIIGEFRKIKKILEQKFDIKIG